MTVYSQSFSARNAFFTLLKKEIIRFQKIAFHSIAAPVLSSLLYLIVFGAALQDKVMTGSQTSYLEFLVPGLVMMAILQNAFANTYMSIWETPLLRESLLI